MIRFYVFILLLVLFSINPIFSRIIIREILDTLRLKRFRVHKIEIFNHVFTKETITGRIIHDKIKFISWFVLFIFLLVIFYPNTTIVNNPVMCNYNLIDGYNFINNDCGKIINNNIVNLNLKTYPNSPIWGNNYGEEIIIIGNYNCEYTRKALKLINNITNTNKKIRYRYINIDNDLNSNMMRCAYAIDENKFWTAHSAILNYDNMDNKQLTNIMTKIGFDMIEINACLKGNIPRIEQKNIDIFLNNSYIFATPTIVINNNAIIGFNKTKINIMINKFVSNNS